MPEHSITMWMVVRRWKEQAGRSMVRIAASMTVRIWMAPM